MKKIILFLILFTVINLAFIPLMSLYGLSICPILRGPGFIFGCAYAGTYIFSVLLVNYILIYFLLKNKLQDFPTLFKNYPSILYVSSYLCSSIIGLIALQILFSINHLTGESRAPEILLLTSLILGVTQAYGLDWAVGGFHDLQTRNRNFDKSWRLHTLRTMAPILIAIIVLVHFLLIQDFLLNRPGVTPISTEELIKQTTYIILFVISWLVATYAFHFLSEKENALKIKNHLNLLEKNQTDFVTEANGSWGLWETLIIQLNHFTKIFDERSKLLKSFSRFVTDEVAQRALKSEIVSTHNEEGKLEEMTVLMTDIRDFTKISEQFKPNEVVSLLNTYFTVMLDETIKHNIVVDKFIGDGILAYVDNRPSLSSTEQNKLAVSAAFGMLKELQVLNKDLTSKNLPALKIGIGIYRGEVIKGYIGSSNKLQHTIIGDTVNRTARLEALCKNLDVPLIITAQVWAQLNQEDQRKFKLFQAVQMKGIEETLDVYGLVSTF